MAFDPDAYLAKQKSGGFDPDAYLAKKTRPLGGDPMRTEGDWVPGGAPDDNPVPPMLRAPELPPQPNVEGDVQAARARLEAQPNMLVRAAQAVKQTAGNVIAHPGGAVEELAGAMSRGMGGKSPEEQLAILRAGGSPFEHTAYEMAQGKKTPAEMEKILLAEIAKRDAMPALEVAGQALAPSVGGATYNAISKALPEATGIVARMGRGAIAAAPAGALDASARAIGQGQSAGDVVRSGLEGGKMGAMGGALVEGATALGQKALSGAPALAQKQLGQQLVSGADPTHARRVMGMKGENLPDIVDFAERNPAVKQAAGNPEAMSRVAEGVADQAGQHTGPIYQALDGAVGEVPNAWVIRELSRKAEEAAKQHGRSAFAGAIADLRDDFAQTAATRGTPNLTHQELRGWVTEVLKNKQRTVGSLAQTQNFELLAEVHGVADDILKDELRQAAAVAPQVAPQVQQLSALNKDIAIGIGLKNAADNAMGRAVTTARKGLGNAVAAGAAGSVLGGGAGLPAAVAAYGVTKAAEAAAPAAGRAIVRGAAGMASAPSAPGFMTTGPQRLMSAYQAERERERERARRMRGEP